jgi:hypothetical protein
MVEIAKKLSAKVQGDDGEVYTGGGGKNFLPGPDADVAPMQPQHTRRASWFRRLFGRGG